MGCDLQNLEAQALRGKILRNKELAELISFASGLVTRYCVRLNTTTSILAGWRRTGRWGPNYICFGENELGEWRRFLLDRRGAVENFCCCGLPRATARL